MKCILLNKVSLTYMTFQIKEKIFLPLPPFFVFQVCCLKNFQGNKKNCIFYLHSVLQPSSFEKREALTSALSEILWRAGEPFGCRVCLPQDTANFPPTPQYKYDGITEKVLVLIS